MRFNPRPAFRPGDARGMSRIDDVHGVSIRARPFGRAMLAGALDQLLTGRVSIRARPFGRAMRAGVAIDSGTRRCFNPRPAFRPGDACVCGCKRGGGKPFQSAPGLSAGRCPMLRLRDLDDYEVSIRARPFGRAML